ncbi:MAG: MEKHLA domain-containing protein [Methylococcaceae bacterium]|nr:MEKHLA domain-containing protein [Methylococcaceae bacterium]
MRVSWLRRLVDVLDGTTAMQVLLKVPCAEASHNAAADSVFNYANDKALALFEIWLG